MNNKISLSYMILIIAPLFFGCDGPVKEKNKNNASASSISLHDEDEKGITHPVTFPVKMEMKDRIVKASGKLVIDRTLWNIRYKSGKFFDNLKDQAIADSIEFDIKIVAKK